MLGSPRCSPARRPWAARSAAGGGPAPPVPPARTRRCPPGLGLQHWAGLPVHPLPGSGGPPPGQGTAAASLSVRGCCSPPRDHQPVFGGAGREGLQSGTVCRGGAVRAEHQRRVSAGLCPRGLPAVSPGDTGRLARHKIPVCLRRIIQKRSRGSRATSALVRETLRRHL